MVEEYRNGLDDGVALGPLVNAEGRDKVIELVDDALAKGVLKPEKAAKK